MDAEPLRPCERLLLVKESDLYRIPGSLMNPHVHPFSQLNHIESQWSMLKHDKVKPRHEALSAQGADTAQSLNDLKSAARLEMVMVMVSPWENHAKT